MWRGKGIRKIPGRETVVARICVLTGIHRKDVNRLLEENETEAGN